VYHHYHQETPSPGEEDGDKSLERFLQEECGCKYARGPCSRLFTQEQYEHVRLDCRDLSRKELDLVVLGQIMAGLSNDPETSDLRYRHGEKARERSSMAFYHHGHRICGTTFRMLHGIGN